MCRTPGPSWSAGSVLDVPAVRRARRNLRLVLDAAVLAAAADGRSPTYRALLTVLVVLVVVLNGAGVHRLDRSGSPGRSTP